MSDIERRFVDLQTTITGTKLGGYAALFDQRSDVGPFWEVLAPTAFRAVLAQNPDVRGLFNHNPDKLLARTTNGSLRLSTDSRGLLFELDLNDDIPTTAEVRALVEAGLITGCSFAFRAESDGQVWGAYEGKHLRTITSVSALSDVSVVTYPQYAGTSVSLRSQPTTPVIDGRTQLFRARIAQTLKGNK